MVNVNSITQNHLEKISDMLGYKPSPAKARRFLRGMNGELKHWEYDEVINFGEMGKVLKVIEFLVKHNYMSIV